MKNLILVSALVMGLSSSAFAVRVVECADTSGEVVKATLNAQNPEYGIVQISNGPYGSGYSPNMQASGGDHGEYSTFEFNDGAQWKFFWDIPNQCLYGDCSGVGGHKITWQPLPSGQDNVYVTNCSSWEQ